mgnify:CR=1 FL=1
MNRRYVLRRLLQVLPAVASILVVPIAVLPAAPGDPVVAVAGESGNEEYYEFMRQKFGLDRPVVEQFWTYATNVLRGDMGVSFVQGQDVVDLILERVPATLLLMGTALVVSTIGGVVLGALAARRHAHRTGTTRVFEVAYAAEDSWAALAARRPERADGRVVYVGSFDTKLYAFDAAGVTNCSGSPNTCAGRVRNVPSQERSDAGPGGHRGSRIGSSGA